MIDIETPRLRLRQWRDADREPFAAMNADPAVMEFFPAPQDRAASDASIDRWRARIEEQGWSNWAVELRETGEFIGFTGLTVPGRVLPFTPCVEIGWRLARAHWGRGYAPEAARAALRVGFERLGLAEIVSFTALANRRSRAVMERIGMRDAHQDFEHPGVPEGHALRPHCLYRIARAQWGALEAIVAFLASIGIAVEERRLEPGTFLPGVAVDRGTVAFDRARLAWPGDLLHEAGHIAVTPPALRSRLSGAIEAELVAPHAGEPEATAWAYAAITALGLEPSILFHPGGYHGKSQGLVFTYGNGVYPGLPGLVAAGLALYPREAAVAGARPYPAMVRWLRE